jgi:hypothetical protein
VKVLSRVSCNEYQCSCKLTSFLAYANILENIQDTMYKICQHILNGGGPFVFNCSAGKDRTGIVAMLLQLIAGVDEAFICWDYGLTETLAPRK